MPSCCSPCFTNPAQWSSSAEITAISCSVENYSSPLISATLQLSLCHRPLLQSSTMAVLQEAVEAYLVSLFKDYQRRLPLLLLFCQA
ncbi:hypothetical protein MUK42_32605 [Musa troglodytarum]|uniref:Uncharacterized protein n=1 Tax=Musa troglodytarum TaxID=320322 RepID=A0A9E7ENX5_9LILI|nr:hypothetical protein MUK42_32605 [Musa troglodytarum]